MNKDASTEEKIKTAAHKVFLEKGYAATRTRDIAEEAGINLALLNYYYRSKEKLFNIIMEEAVKNLLSVMHGIVNDEVMALETKIDRIVDRYSDLLLENPHLPLFVLGELQAQPEYLLNLTGLKRNFMMESVFYKQIRAQLDSVGKKNLSPIHVIVNLLGMSMFPIIARPFLKNMLNTMDITPIVNERRKLIPIWIKEMIGLNTNNNTHYIE